jgi:hypothetical protein
MLCNPLAEEKQADILSVLLDEVQLDTRLEALEILAAQRPVLAVRLAQNLVEDPRFSQEPNRPEIHQAQPLADSLDQIIQRNQQAAAYRLAALPGQAIPVLAESRCTRPCCWPAPASPPAGESWRSPARMPARPRSWPG